jgi:outer membrane cobalamin receptor
MLTSSLRPETSLSYDLGFYRRLGKNFDMRISGNYINTSNYFVTNTASSYFNGSYAYQIPTMKFYGTEFEFNWKPFEKLVLFGNYSFLKNKYTRDSKLPYAMILELPPRNKGKLSVRYELPLKTRLAADVKFIGERKSEGGFNLNRYATADLSFERNFAERMTAGFFINNMTGTDYQQVYGYPAPGVTYGIRIQISTAKSILAR